MENLQLGTMPCKIGLPKVRDQEVGGSNPLAPTNPREFSMKSMSCSVVLLVCGLCSGSDRLA